MAQRSTSAYRFDSLGLNPVEPGTNVLLCGRGEALDRAVWKLLDGPKGATRIVVAPHREARRVREEVDRHVGGPSGSIGVVAGGDRDVDDDAVRVVDGPADFATATLELRSLMESLRGRTDDVRVGLTSVVSLVEAVDDSKAAFRFFHNATGRIRRSEGLGVFVLDRGIDAETIDVDTFEQGIRPAFDARIRVSEGPTGLSLDRES